MKKHQIIFEKIKRILKQHFNNNIEEYEDGSYLSLGDSGIWISSDERELTIGYGFSHRHYDPEFDNIGDALEEFFDLLTKRKRITIYYKGTFQFKNKTEIEIDKNRYKYLGTSMTWLYPYWKKTTTSVEYSEKLLDESVIQNEIQEIKDYAQH